MSPQPPRLSEILPAHASRFGEVAGMLRDGAPATAFTKAAEVLLDRFEEMSKVMQPYAVLKLAIEMHRHGLFCEVAQDKARTAHDEAAFDKFQEYLHGDADVPVALGLPAAASSTTPLEIDLDEMSGSTPVEEPNGEQGK